MGEFRISGYSKIHKSSLYQIENTTEPYPMECGLRFYIKSAGVSYWIHGHDMPGYPVSHGCIGLYDEGMQHTYYNYPGNPVMEDARKLFELAIPGPADGDGLQELENGPKVLIVGRASRIRDWLHAGQSIKLPGREHLCKS